MTKFLTVEQVIQVHDVFLDEYGGLPGIRDFGLLSSAVEMPRFSCFGKLLHETIFEQAAAYLYHLIMNHPFNDGNKRTGALVALFFLEENGVQIHFSDTDYEDFVVEVAKGHKTKEDSASYFLKNCHFD
jgi:death on curing protein